MRKVVYVSFKELPDYGVPKYSRVHTLRLMRRGQFPQQVQISPNRVGWLLSGPGSIEEWLASRPLSSRCGDRAAMLPKREASAGLATGACAADFGSVMFARVVTRGDFIPAPELEVKPPRAAASVRCAMAAADRPRNRAERRAQGHRQRAPSATGDIHDFHDDCCGFFRITIHRRDRIDFSYLAGGLLAGDVQVKALEAALRRLAAAKAAGGLPDCLVCGAPLTTVPAVVLVLLPERPDQSLVMASGCCPACERLPDAEIMARAAALLRAGAWPGLRAIDPAAIVSAGGRA